MQRIVLPVTICAGGHVADIMAAMGVDSGPASVWDDETAAVTRRYLSTVDRDGCRANPWRWLESALETSTAGRLCVLGDTTVERVLFTEGAACGLLLRGRDGVEVELALPDALSEVILCAGSIQSPRILMATMNLAGTDCALHRRCLSLPALFGERNTNCGRLAHERLYVSVDTGDEVAERSSCTRTQLGKSALAGLPIGKGLQDHVLLPVVLLNVSNIAAMSFNVFIWILNCLVRVASLQLNYYSLTGNDVQCLLSITISLISCASARYCGRFRGEWRARVGQPRRRWLHGARVEAVVHGWARSSCYD